MTINNTLSNYNPKETEVNNNEQQWLSTTDHVMKMDRFLQVDPKRRTDENQKPNSQPIGSHEALKPCPSRIHLFPFFFFPKNYFLYFLPILLGNFGIFGKLNSNFWKFGELMKAFKWT